MTATAIMSGPGTVGYMPMPVSFAHRSLFLQGRPKHEKFSDFWRKHPPMDTTHRAKIFAPFDALAGFDECIESKLITYREKRTLSDEEKGKLDAALSTLHSLTYNSRVARLNRPQAPVTYFVPCVDEHSEWYRIGGKYETVSGIVSKVDAIVEKVLVIDEQIIPFDTISEITIVETNSCGQEPARNDSGSCLKKIAAHKYSPFMRPLSLPVPLEKIIACF